MKRITLILIIAALFYSCSYKRIGDLSIIANRNVDFKGNYQLVQNNVEGVSKMKKGDALEQAIDNATELHNGEYLLNAKIYIKSNGNKIKVVGDVYKKID